MNLETAKRIVLNWGGTNRAREAAMNIADRLPGLEALVGSHAGALAKRNVIGAGARALEEAAILVLADAIGRDDDLETK